MFLRGIVLMINAVRALTIEERSVYCQRGGKQVPKQNKNHLLKTLLLDVPIFSGRDLFQ